MCCRFAFMGEEEKGNVDCTDLFFIRKLSWKELHIW